MARSDSRGPITGLSRFCRKRSSRRLESRPCDKSGFQGKSLLEILDPGDLQVLEKHTNRRFVENRHRSEFERSFATKAIRTISVFGSLSIFGWRSSRILGCGMRAICDKMTASKECIDREGLKNERLAWERGGAVGTPMFVAVRQVGPA